jgi:hypothetical protein
MSYLMCSHGSKIYPFGRGGKARIGKVLGVPHECVPFHALPLVVSEEDDGLNDDPEESVLNSAISDPLVLERPTSLYAQIFDSIARDLISELFHRVIDDVQVLLTGACLKTVTNPYFSTLSHSLHSCSYHWCSWLETVTVFGQDTSTSTALKSS